MLNPLYGGLQFVENTFLTVTKFNPRSPARAKRRAKKGYRQHVANVPNPDVFRMGNVVMGHPVTIANLKEKFFKELTKCN